MTPVAYNEAAALRDPAVRFGAAFIAAASEIRPLLIRKYSDWRDIPRIMTSGQAVDSRLTAMSAGTKARVDFKRVFASFAKQRLAELEQVSADNGQFRFTKPVEDKLALTIDWHHKSGFGIGKLLELSIGARWDDNFARMRWPLPMFWGFAHSADWAYSTKEDLEACLDAGADFAKVLLPPLGEALAKNMAMAEIPGGAGAATAREAFAIAKREMARIRSLAGPDSVYNANLRFAGVEIRHTTGHWGPLTADDGRIRVHAAWSLQFVAASGDGVSMQVAYTGAPFALQFTKGISRVEPVEEGFVDSSVALGGVAHDSRFPEKAVFTGLKLGYQQPYMPGACWRVDFIVPNTTIRGLAWVDAADGTVLFHGR